MIAALRYYDTFAKMGSQVPPITKIATALNEGNTGADSVIVRAMRYSLRRALSLDYVDGARITQRLTLQASWERIALLNSPRMCFLEARKWTACHLLWSWWIGFAAAFANPGNCHPSGGRVFIAATDLKDAIASCVADASAYYVLTFAAARADQANEYHSLQVTVDKPGMTARTRTGYYAQP
jgi:hypothetical protein